MEKSWVQVSKALARVVDSGFKAWMPFSDAEHTHMDAFVAIYKDHIQNEEGLVYPAAKRALDFEQLQVMSRDMVRRRSGGHSGRG